MNEITSLIVTKDKTNVVQTILYNERVVTIIQHLHLCLI